MATYSELEDLFGDPTLTAKCRVALIIAAQTVFDEDPATANHANRVIWARAVLSDTEPRVNAAVRAILAANASASVAQIQGATDTSVQANIDAIIDLFADGSQ